MDRRATLLRIWQAGVDAVRGDHAVAAALTRHAIAPPDRIIAVGKAAAAMARAALDRFPGTPTLVVTKYGHSQPLRGAEVIEAAHPVPDAASLRAGAALIEAVQACPPGSHLLMLVSGGASALAESLPEDWTLDRLAEETTTLLASGADIHAMNARRKTLSRIKGGKLLARFAGTRVTTLAISDVEGDALSVIGSGIGDAPETAPFAFDPHIVASNAIARDAAERGVEGLPLIRNAEILYDDVRNLAPHIAANLIAGPAGLHILGGEPTVVLPSAPGRGGRNMALALHLAREIAGRSDIAILVAGTDGSDGPTDAAGAYVDGTTWEATGDDALARADAYPWLDARGALVKSGPTGTNVMDLLVALKT